MLNRKIPTLIALIILGGFTVISVLLLNRPTQLLSSVSATSQPQAVTITNLSATAFTVTWLTATETSGSVVYGTNPRHLNQVILDDRDRLTGREQTYLTHAVTVKPLSPATVYYFQIHGQSLASSDQLYQVTTLAPLPTLPRADIAFGQVLNQAGLPAANTLVYLIFPAAVPAAPVSTLTSLAGQWAINLSTIRTPTGEAYINYDRDNSQLYLTYIAGLGDKASLTTTTANDQPAPTVTLGETIDWRELPLTPPTQVEVQVPIVPFK
ncbi:hypothetical protein A2W24_03145 [Microgenomates group bacterium RBG_16_45_19]|nr:MAG: hypothetical protein A2W24_03145 [Microgenomates group bacterium RBG_16_45_19]